MAGDLRGVGQEAWCLHLGEECDAGEDAGGESGLFVPIGGVDAQIGAEMGVVDGYVGGSLCVHARMINDYNLPNS